MNAHDLIKEAIAEKGKFDSVYWIACGGSMIDLIPAHELLQREATTFTSYIYTAREFDIMRPRRLGEKSLVIACSHSGNTPEVVFPMVAIQVIGDDTRTDLTRVTRISHVLSLGPTRRQRTSPLRSRGRAAP